MRLLALTALGLVLAGFGSSAPSRIVSKPPSCPFTGTTAGLRNWGCAARGDVDGDGSPDRVWIGRAPSGRFFLLVRTRAGVVRAPIVSPAFQFAKPSELSVGFPRVQALRPMNRARGLEPEVLIWRSASNSGLIFYTLRRGRLAPMRIVPAPPDSPFEWDDGGFAAAYVRLGCVAPHVVGEEGGGIDDRHRWHAFAARYRVEASRFVREATYARVYREPPNRYPPEWPHPRLDEFRSCGGVETDLRGLGSR